MKDDQRRLIASIWLQVMGGICVGIAVLIIGASVLNSTAPGLTRTFFGFGAVNPEIHRFILYMYGEYGAAVLTFGVFVFSLAKFGIRSTQPWVKTTLLWAVTLWILGVLVGNIAAKTYSIAIANLLGFGLLLGIPVFLIPGDSNAPHHGDRDDHHSSGPSM